MLANFSQRLNREEDEKTTSRIEIQQDNDFFLFFFCQLEDVPMARGTDCKATPAKTARRLEVAVP